MTQRNKITRLWFAGGLLFSMLLLSVVFSGLSGQIWITNPEGISETAIGLMNAIRIGNWNALEDMVSGDDILCPDISQDSSAEEIIYRTYQKSLQWTCEDGFTTRGKYVMQKVTVKCLDIPNVTEAISGVLSEATPNSGVTQEDLLHSAAEQVLDSQMPMVQHTITLTFLRENGQWMLVPDNALLALLSGFTAH